MYSTEMAYAKKYNLNVCVTLEGRVIYKDAFIVESTIGKKDAERQMEDYLEIYMEEQEGYTPGEIGCMAFDVH